MSNLRNLGVRPWRIWTLHGVVVAMLGLLGYAIGVRQLTQSEDYAEREKLQHLRRILLPGPRGRILDRHGLALVENRPRFDVAVYLAELRPEFRRALAQKRRELAQAGQAPAPDLLPTVRAAVVQGLVDRVNQLTGRQDRVRPRDLDRHFGSQLLLPFTVVEGLGPEQVAAVLEQIPPGSPLQVIPSPRRTYPYGEAAAHSLGYVRTVETESAGDDEFSENLMTFSFRDLRGDAGLEKQFDAALQGRPGDEIWMVDPSGRQYRKVASRAPEPGKDLVTSLDIQLQLAAERAMGEQRGAVVAIEVRTGEVLVLASRPGFDLNAYQDDRNATVARMNEQGAWENRALRGLYPPGSTFKLVTASAGLRAGTLHDDTHAFCEGSLMVGQRSFPCHRRSGHGEVDLLEAIRASCNVFFYEAGLAVGVDRLSEEARAFGLAEPTGVELPDETRRMLVPDKAWKQRTQDESWFPGDTANFAIGQGFLRVTPLQMACLVASLARGEMRTHPTLLHRPEAPTQKGPEIDLPAGAYERIQEGMERVTTLGTGRLARIEGVRIAGKTGTAQVRTPGGTLELAWFLGFAPIERPEIAIAVILEGDQPDQDFAGGLKAAPVARAVLERHFENRRALPAAGPQE